MFFPGKAVFSLLLTNFPLPDLFEPPLSVASVLCHLHSHPIHHICRDVDTRKPRQRQVLPLRGLIFHASCDAKNDKLFVSKFQRRSLGILVETFSNKFRPRLDAGPLNRVCSSKWSNGYIYINKFEIFKEDKRLLVFVLALTTRYPEVRWVDSSGSKWFHSFLSLKYCLPSRCSFHPFLRL